MPKTKVYQRKRTKSYTKDTLAAALLELEKSGTNASINSIAKKFNIPEPSLRRHKGKQIEVFLY